MSSSIHTVIADEGDLGLRIDRFLSARLPELSRSRLQALIAQGCITGQGGTIADASRKVKPGERFEVTVPETAPSHIEAQAIALAIVYEDEHLLVIDKPPGMTVHPAPGNRDNTLVNALLAHCGASLSGIGGVARPGIVHRIDKDTSGLLVVAKHDAAHLALSAQLADRRLKRTYLAVAWGVPKIAAGTITGNIGRSISNRQKMAVVKTGGKPAVTHYRAVASDQWPGASKRRDEQRATSNEQLFSLLECRLETGRTHQIRVHLTHLGHPLVGDPVYGQSTPSRLNAGTYKQLPDSTREALLAFKRQALHARALELIHPATNEKMRFEAELPEDMRRLIEALRYYRMAR